MSSEKVFSRRSFRWLFFIGLLVQLAAVAAAYVGLHWISESFAMLNQNNQANLEVSARIEIIAALKDAFFVYIVPGTFFICLESFWIFNPPMTAVSPSFTISLVVAVRVKMAGAPNTEFDQSGSLLSAVIFIVIVLSGVIWGVTVRLIAASTKLVLGLPSLSVI